MTSSLRALLVEDSASDAKLVVRELERIGRPIVSQRVETEGALRAALEQQPWDIVLSDWSMPKFSGLAALNVVRGMGLDLPFIIVSGTVGEDSAVDAMRGGANDYVLKDKLGRLGPAVERELRECQERRAHARASKSLRESQARFARLAESGIIGITTVSVLGPVIDANDAYLELIGYTRKELLEGGLQWKDLTPPELAERAERALEQLQVTGVATPWETETLRRDGTRVPILAGAAMLDYPQCIAFTADLTERKRAEEGRMRAEEALHKSQDQLRQAQKMEAVGRLAGGVAHDFNNILSIILSYGELSLRDLRPADPVRRNIEQLCNAAESAARLTQQLLMFSRQRVVETKVVDISHMIQGMEKMLQRLLGEDVELVTRPSSESARVKVDPSHLEQVILNLVVNARDAMLTGGKVTIEAHNVVLDDVYAQEHPPSKAGPHVMLAVSDTGTGIDRETQQRMFEPFFTTKPVGKGTGLGLSTVFGIVQQSGGSIWVYSEVGCGTTFKIFLPRVDADVDAPRRHVSLTTLHGNETILVVEDEQKLREVLVDILQRQGYQLIVAADGTEALRLAAAHVGRIDLLLSDVVMPNMSGPELAKRLLLERPDTKLLCMSGYTDERIVQHGLLESVAFLQKPVTPLALATQVRALLDQAACTS